MKSIQLIQREGPQQEELPEELLALHLGEGRIDLRVHEILWHYLHGRGILHESKYPVDVCVGVYELDGKKEAIFLEVELVKDKLDVEPPILHQGIQTRLVIMLGDKQLVGLRQLKVDQLSDSQQ